MTRHRLFASFAAAALGLSACGPDYEAPAFISVASTAVPALGNIVPGAGDEERTAPPGFRPEDMQANPGAYQIIGVATLSQPAPARVIESGGDEVTWQSQAGYTAAFDDGMLVATRGLGDDLMAANADQTRAALARGGGSAIRVHETLDSLDQIVTARYECTIVDDGLETVDSGLRQRQGRKFTETCRGSGVQFENAYWLDGSGSIFASRQFVSQTVAYLRANRL